ncbi:MAG: uracil-DNA glycosylase [Pseudomonadota bacterium]
MTRPPLTRFFRLLHANPGPHVFNPWTHHDAGTDVAIDAHEHRLKRLETHLNTDAKYLLIGEAAGYQGCHVTGIPFTSERLILEGQIPGIASDGTRLSTRHIPWSEPSATTVWATLHDLGIADTTILWNAYPWHPHKPGNRQSNRTPTLTERGAGLSVLAALLTAFPNATLFAVGRNAEAALLEMGHHAIPLRHPSMGGATAFRSQLRRAV